MNELEAKNSVHHSQVLLPEDAIADGVEQPPEQLRPEQFVLRKETGVVLTLVVGAGLQLPEILQCDVLLFQVGQQLSRSR